MELSKSYTGKKSKTYQMAGIGIMAALISVLGPLSLPIGPVPISLTNLAIFVSLYAVGMKNGTISLLIYLLLGFLGLPIFSGYSGGPAKILGPTGGYLIGFIFMALIAGYFIDKFIDRWYLCVIGMILASAILYAFGTAWLAYQANLSARAALSAGVIPFIPGDLLKIFAAAFIGPKIRSRLIKANLY